jgi:O-antigen ligase
LTDVQNCHRTLSTISKKKSNKLLNFLLFFLTILLVSRVHQSFVFLHSFRLTLITYLLITLTLICSGGFQWRSIIFLFYSKTFKYLFIFWLISLVGVPFSIYRSGSLLFLLNLLETQGIYLVALGLYVNRMDDLRPVIKGAFFSLLCIELVALFMGEIESGRLVGTSAYDSNDLALALIILCALLWPGRRYQTYSVRLMFSIMVCLALYLLFLTKSRGGVVVAFTVFLSIALNEKKGVMIKYLLIAILCMGCLYLFLDAGSLGRLVTLGDLGNDYNMSSEKGRLAIWGKGVKLICENPVLGTGMSTYQVASGESGGVWMTAHNIFVQIAVEIGIPGVTIFIAALVSAYRCAAPYDEHDWLGKGIRFAIVSIVVGGMFLSWAYQPLLYFILIVAIIRESVLKSVGNSEDQIYHSKRRFS